MLDLALVDQETMQPTDEFSCLDHCRGLHLSAGWGDALCFLVGFHRHLSQLINRNFVALLMFELQTLHRYRDVTVLQQLASLHFDGFRLHVPGVIGTPVRLARVARLNIGAGECLLFRCHL